ncbi:palmitoyl protein thioesterase [Chloropicon roscoffensis]|uniref:Palmitoyl-protein thioesterase 1 n=1 Tax=Chloropicon roscoffensis TaxID=1461544 RepID=A0AAX4PDT5_9CHLO
MTLCVVALLVALAMAAGSGASAELVGPSPSEPLPVVLWHGMGDTCCNPKSMGRVKDLIQQEIGAYVVSIRLGATEAEDQRAGFFGLVPVQIAHVCHELASDSRLSAGFNAVGFSQGGQFLRAVVQVCPTLVPNFPRTSALVTLGGQHQGVMDWPGCGDAASTALCRSLQALLAFGAYSDFLQRRVVQAQYFKDPRKMDEYLQKNVFLPDINNEKALNEDYKRNLARLDLLMLLMWKNDTTVVPRESSLFGVLNATSGVIVPLREQPLYKEDRLGLRALDERGALIMDVMEGEHMELNWEFFNETIVHGVLGAAAF